MRFKFLAIFCFFFVWQLIQINGITDTSTTTPTPTNSSICNPVCLHGKCEADVQTNNLTNKCTCDVGYTALDCSYEQKSQLRAFLLSFFLGNV
jgi:hypothetical protein